MTSDPSGPSKRNIYDQWVLDTFGVDPSTYPPLRAPGAAVSTFAPPAPAGVRQDAGNTGPTTAVIETPRQTLQPSANGVARTMGVATGLPGLKPVDSNGTPLPHPVMGAAARQTDDAGDAQPPPDIPGSDYGDGDSPGPITSVFRQVFGHVDPDAWGAKGAAAGGLSGALMGGLVGGAGEGALGTLAGTAVEPGGGTLLGGVAGAIDGATRGAVIGGVAGAAVLGTAAKLTGVLVNHMESSEDGGSTGNEQNSQPSPGAPQPDQSGTGSIFSPPEVSSQDIAAFRKRINVPVTNTVGVGRTNIPCLKNRTFEGASTIPRREGGLLPAFEGPIASPNSSPRFRNHAEQDIANQFVKAVEEAELQVEDMRGREFLIKIQNEDGVCTICRQGLRNPDVPAGVLKQLSERYPDLRIHVIVDNPGPNLVGEADFILLNGTYIP